MTGPEDHSSTRPISVAELLAKNGTIGSPPVGGRRRRRRGNSDSITVAELTGEIPIVRDVPKDEAETAPADEHVEAAEPVSADGDIDEAEQDLSDAVPAEADSDDPADVGPDDVEDDVEADYTAHIEQREADFEPVEFQPPRRPQYGQPRYEAPAGVDAEQMSPDPVIGEDDDEDTSLLTETTDIEDTDADTDAADVPSDSEITDVGPNPSYPVPSYMRSTDGPLFGGQTVADDLARRGVEQSPGDLDLDVDEAERAPASPMSTLLQGAWIVGQCIFAVLLGAGLFIAFDQLWKWNNIVALVLSVLVILGLVVAVRVVRKTEDIGSTLIAVAVGALVTLGPLALLQSN